MPHPCMSSSANVFRMSRSSVPCSRSVLSPTVPLVHLQEQLECHSCRWTTRELKGEQWFRPVRSRERPVRFRTVFQPNAVDLEPNRLRKHLYGELMPCLFGAATRAATRRKSLDSGNLNSGNNLIQEHIIAGARLPFYRGRWYGN